MKVVLKEEVYNLGLAGDVVDVADGYGRNYLLPAGIAIPATEGAIREAEQLTRARKAREAETVDEAREEAEQIESRTLRIEVRVDETGTLYGSVGRGDIQRVLKERGHKVDERKIDLTGTIKQIGSHEIPVQIHPQVTATATVEIVDVEGEVGVEEEEPQEPSEPVEVDVDELSVSEAAKAAAVGSDTNVEALAEQALQAAREYEEQQVLSGASEPAAEEPADGEEASAESDESDTTDGESDTADDTPIDAGDDAGDDTEESDAS